MWRLFKNLTDWHTDKLTHCYTDRRTSEWIHQTQSFLTEQTNLKPPVRCYSQTVTTTAEMTKCTNSKKSMKILIKQKNKNKIFSIKKIIISEWSQELKKYFMYVYNIFNRTCDILTLSCWWWNPLYLNIQGPWTTSWYLIPIEKKNMWKL